MLKILFRQNTLKVRKRLIIEPNSFIAFLLTHVHLLIRFRVTIVQLEIASLRFGVKFRIGDV